MVIFTNFPVHERLKYLQVSVNPIVMTVRVDLCQRILPNLRRTRRPLTSFLQNSSSSSSPIFNKMLTTTYFFALLVAAFAGLQNVAAVPAAESAKVYPEVVPGPGLPSLEELGLTSEQLYTTTPTINGRELFPRYTSVCETYTTADVDDTIACFNYLQAIGSNNCGVSGDNVQFCYSGNAQITGSNISGTGSASSACSDVAFAVQWVFTYCNQDGNVGGSCAAYGNGNLIVGVENLDY